MRAAAEMTRGREGLSGGADSARTQVCHRFFRAASTTKARGASSTGGGIEPFQFMMNGKELPHVEFADYTFVFH
jgi:hypothetical protein